MSSRHRTDDGISSLQVVRLIAAREVVERLRAKSFFVVTGLLVAGILAVGFVALFASDDEPGPIEVGLVDEPAAEQLPAHLDQAASLFDRTVAVETFATTGLARAALEDGQLDVTIAAAQHEAVFDSEPGDEVEAIVRQAWSSAQVQDGLADAGLSSGEIEAALTPAPLQAESLDDEDELSGLVILTGTAAAVLLFISLQTFGNYVLMGVVEEKSSAVVELLMARARADQLLAGKVLGIGLVALLQFVCAVLAALASLLLSGVDVPSEIWSAVPMTVVWFLAGYLFYTTLFAMAGALASRQEDAQGAAAPIMTLLILAYVLVFLFGYDPDSRASTIMSLVPPLAPFLMPMRMTAGAASVAEVAAAVALLLLATWLLWKVAGRIYERVLLRRGSRIAWSDALALVRGS